RGGRALAAAAPPRGVAPRRSCAAAFTRAGKAGLHGRPVMRPSGGDPAEHTAGAFLDPHARHVASSTAAANGAGCFEKTRVTNAWAKPRRDPAPGASKAVETSVFWHPIRYPVPAEGPIR